MTADPAANAYATYEDHQRRYHDAYGHALTRFHTLSPRDRHTTCAGLADLHRHTTDAWQAYVDTTIAAMETDIR